jgi:hypothetical protein
MNQRPMLLTEEIKRWDRIKQLMRPISDWAKRQPLAKQWFIRGSISTSARSNGKPRDFSSAL